MKAQLLALKGGYKLVSDSGKITHLSSWTAKQFLLDYTNEVYYISETDVQSKELKESKSPVVAYITDDLNLLVCDVKHFKKIMTSTETEYVTAEAYADIHGKTIAIIRRHARDGRLGDSYKVGATWLIPKDFPYPTDGRVGKDKKKKK